MASTNSGFMPKTFYIYKILAFRISRCAKCYCQGLQVTHSVRLCKYFYGPHVLLQSTEMVWTFQDIWKDWVTKCKDYEVQGVRDLEAGQRQPGVRLWKKTT